MVDLSTDNWSFCFEEPKEISLPIDGEILPFITSPEAWKQYNNEAIYEADVLTRQWIEALSKNSKWRTNKNMRRYTFKMIFEQIKGRPYDQKRDAGLTVAYTKVFSYYSSRIQKSGSINDKHYSKTIYTISPQRLNKLPYSLKLRLEYLADNGQIPTTRNMALPDDLQPGHARNPRTDENMRRRRELGRQRYAGRYNKSSKARSTDSR